MGWVANRWTCVAAAIWIQWSCGASYTFSIYSSILKSTQGYHQSTLDTVSVFKDIGANFGVLSGLLNSAVAPGSPSKSQWTSFCGPWLVLAAGAAQCFAGFIFIWASVVGLISPPPVPVMCFFAWLAANGQSFLNTTNVVTGLRNFPDYSGTIIGIMKGFLGLSGAILIQIYHTFFDGDPITYLLMLAVLPSFICVLLMLLVRIYKVHGSDYKKHLDGFSLVTVIIVVYLMFIIILQNVVSLSYRGRMFAFVILMVLLASPFGIAIKAHWEESRKFAQSYTMERGSSTNKGTSSSSSSYSTSVDQVEYHELPSEEGQAQMISDDKLPHEEEKNLLQAMCTVEFWMLFVIMISGLGSGLATINNMSQIGQSLGYSTMEINNLVSLWSMWNFLGRFGGGNVSDYIMHRKGWPRPLLMTATLGIMILGHITIASGFRGNFYLGPVLVGICYGAHWSLMPTITSEIFGVQHMGTIFNTIAAASPLGSYILSVRVVGYIYDMQADKEDNLCFGIDCFMSSFFILAGVAFLAFLVGLALYFRTRRFYKQVVLIRLKHYAR